MGEFTGERATWLDGNAAAGLLGELFCREPSEAVIVCAGCDAAAPIGALLVYGLEMGAILRCPHCDTAVLRVGVTGAVRSIDMRGAARLRLTLDR